MKMGELSSDFRFDLYQLNIWQVKDAMLVFIYSNYRLYKNSILTREFNMTSHQSSNRQGIHHSQAEMVWFDVLPGEQVAYRVHGKDVNNEYSVFDLRMAPTKEMAPSPFIIKPTKFSVSWKAKRVSMWMAKNSMQVQAMSLSFQEVRLMHS